MRISEASFLKGPWSLIIILVLASFMALWNLDGQEIYEWDESRQGINAIEMLKQADYVNLYYNGEPDTWNAKPPLLVWCMAASYKAFGFNAFAMRFPAALFIIAFFYFAFRLIEDFRGRGAAFFTCLILIGSQAIFVRHIGRSADFDAPLLCFQFAFLWQFFRFQRNGKLKHALWAGLCLGLAFYSKAFAAFFVIPGLLVYLLWQKQLLTLFKRKGTWLSAGIVIAFVVSWFVLLLNYGATNPNATQGAESSIETMIVDDLLTRFSDDNFTPGNHSHGFVFSTLDIHLNLWNYLFYLCVLIALIVLIRRKISLRNISEKYPLETFGLIHLFVLGGILTVSATQHYWYFASSFVLVALFIFSVFDWMGIKRGYLWGLPAFVLCVQLFFHLEMLTNEGNYANRQFKTYETEIEAATHFYLFDVYRQDLFLVSRWSHDEAKIVTNFPSEVLPNDLIMTTQPLEANEYESLFTIDRQFTVYRKRP